MKHRALGKLPAELVSRQVLDDLRQRLREEGIELRDEPDWQELRPQLENEHGVRPADIDEAVAALERLWLLPFHRYDACSPLLIYFFAGLRAAGTKFKNANDTDGLLLCRAFRVMVDLMLQGIAVFPGEPHHIGQVLMNAITSPSTTARRNLLPLARLLAESAEGRCGANFYLSKSPNEIAVYEHHARRGQFEDVLASAHKFESYSRQLEKNPLFWKEWEALKSDFKKHAFWDEYCIVRRSLLPEGNWRKDPLPKFNTLAESFQPIFDVFCWKWFLYGMQRADPRDRPLVQKVSYTFSPYGTTIFIPGYWSFDPRRDLDWKAITRLHKARGVEKQGEKLASNRTRRGEQVRRLKSAAIEAMRMSLRGEKRMRFLKRAAGLSMETDDAYIRRLLRESPVQKS